MVFDLFSGMNLDKAIDLASQLGCDVCPVRRTGELRFKHVLASRPCRVAGHRRDAPRHLVVWLRHIQALLN